MKKFFFALAAIALLAEPTLAMPIRAPQDATVSAQTIEKTVYVGTRGSARRTTRRVVRRHTY